MVVPPQLYLHDVLCLDQDRLNARQIGGFADIHLGRYQGRDVALKKLRVSATSHDNQKFHSVSPRPIGCYLC